MAFHVFLFLLVFFLLLSGAALASVLAPSSAFPLTSREQTHQGCTGAGAGSPHYEAVEARRQTGQSSGVRGLSRRGKLVRVSQVMRLGTEDLLTAALQGLGLSGRLNTAFIARVNLSVRHGVAALARRTWATAQQASHLFAHLEWWRAYYHFVRPHASLRVALVQPRARGGKRLAQRYRQRTPAMAAGRTNRRWTACEVLSCPLPKGSA